jgi:hypothetical protein
MFSVSLYVDEARRRSRREQTKPTPIATIPLTATDAVNPAWARP